MLENEGLNEPERKQIIEKIAKESDRLIDELLAMIYNPDTDNRIKIQAIGMLIDRSLPKLAVAHGKSESVEESNSKKKLRSEIEELIKKSK